MYHKSTGQQADARKEMYYYLLRKYGHKKVWNHIAMITKIGYLTEGMIKKIGGPHA